MRQGEVLLEERAETYRPLGAFGQPVHLSYVQLRATVAQKLSPRAANLFATPQVDARGHTIRWVAPVAGTPRSWNDLAPEEQTAHALDLQILRGEFDMFLAELDAAEGAQGSEAFASVLRQALKTPNDGHLHFVGDQPVMTFWGFSELTGASFEPLAAPAPAPAEAPPERPAAATPPPIAAAPVGRRFPPWLLWLIPLLLLLLLLLLWWLFWKDDRPIDPAVTPTPPVETLAPEDRIAEPDRIDGRIVDENGRVIDRRVLDRDGAVIDGVVPDGVVPGEVIPSEIVPEGVVPDGVVPDDVIPSPLEDDQKPDADAPLDPTADPTTPDEPPAGETPQDPAGEEPAPDAAPPEPEAPEADQAAAPEAPQDQAQDPAPENPGDALALPPPTPPASDAPGAAGAPANLKFLKGRWKSDTPLVDENNRKLDHRYEFDDSGKGKSIVRRQDGVECVADAEARMQNGKLRIVESSGPRCPDGQEFEKSDTTCEVGGDGKTRCRGEGYNADIRRAPK